MVLIRASARLAARARSARSAKNLLIASGRGGERTSSGVAFGWQREDGGKKRYIYFIIISFFGLLLLRWGDRLGWAAQQATGADQLGHRAHSAGSAFVGPSAERHPPVGEEAIFFRGQTAARAWRPGINAYQNHGGTEVTSAREEVSNVTNGAANIWEGPSPAFRERFRLGFPPAVGCRFSFFWVEATSTGFSPSRAVRGSQKRSERARRILRPRGHRPSVKAPLWRSCTVDPPGPAEGGAE